MIQHLKPPRSVLLAFLCNLKAITSDVEKCKVQLRDRVDKTTNNTNGNFI